MKLSSRNLTLSLGVALACIGSSALHADVRYTLTNSMASGEGSAGVPGGAGLSMETTRFIKTGKQREETTSSMGKLFSQKTVTITLCDKQKMYKLDEDLKIYTVEPIGGLAVPSSGPPRPGRPAPKASGPPGDGKVSNTITVEEMGTEKIGDLTTHHAMITMHMQMSGCAGSTDNTMKMELWTAPVKVFVCPETMAPSRTVTTGSGCKVTYEVHGDMEALKKVYGGMIVRQKIYLGDKPFMTQDMKDFSEKDLDDSLFAIPDGYKEVSASEYDQAEQKARMDKIRSGLGTPRK